IEQTVSFLSRATALCVIAGRKKRSHICGCLSSRVVPRLISTRIKKQTNHGYVQIKRCREEDGFSHATWTVNVHALTQTARNNLCAVRGGGPQIEFESLSQVRYGIVGSAHNRRRPPARR